MTILDGMSSFVAVVEQGSFTKAADSLGQTKSSVSKHISKLEERLGVKLLNRTTRKLTLTDAGQGYFDKAASIIEQAEEAEAEITSLQIAPKGTLRLTMPLSFGITEMQHILPGFQDKYPQLKLDVFLSDQILDLMEGNYDLAIRAGKLRDSSLIARKIGESDSLVVASPEYWKKHGKPKTIEELSQHNCMQYSNASNPNVWNFIDENGKHVDIKIDGNLRCNNSGLEMAMAANGNGVCRLPRFICQSEIDAGHLEPVLDGYNLGNIGIYVVYLPSRHVPTKIRAFIDYLVDNLQNIRCATS